MYTNLHRVYDDLEVDFFRCPPTTFLRFDQINSVSFIVPIELEYCTPVLVYGNWLVMGSFFYNFSIGNFHKYITNGRISYYTSRNGSLYTLYLSSLPWIIPGAPSKSVEFLEISRVTWQLCYSHFQTRLKSLFDQICHEYTPAIIT